MQQCVWLIFIAGIRLFKVTGTALGGNIIAKLTAGTTLVEFAG